MNTVIIKEVRLNPAGAAYVIQMALRATNVPMADSFGPYITNALNWVYQNGGHFGVAENSPLDQYMAQAVQQAQAQTQTGQQRPVQSQQQPVQQVQQPRPRPLPVQQAQQAQQPYIQHPPHMVPVQAPMAQIQHPGAQPAPAPQTVQVQPVQPDQQGAPGGNGEAPSLTSAPVNPAIQESLANSDAVLLG